LLIDEVLFGVAAADAYQKHQDLKRMRNIAPSVSLAYQELLGSSKAQQIYLNELPQSAETPIGAALLQLIAQSSSQAVAHTQRLHTLPSLGGDTLSHQVIIGTGRTPCHNRGSN
jgi:hypothetical protein